MHTQSDAEKNSAADIVPPPRSTAPWRVTAVKSLQGYRLHVRFVDGTEGTVDMSSMLQAADAGVFSVLTDTALFNQVSVVRGAVTWPGELDLAPDAMYDAIKAHGEWVLR